MSPSRGSAVSPSPPSATSKETTLEIETAADASSKSALRSLKQNVHFLFDPASSTQPARFRTRALLRTLRYASIFIFWRVVRYAKYAVVGSIVAAVSATAFGGMISGVGWILAPPSIIGSVGIGILWWGGRFAFRRLRIGQKVAERGEVNQRRDTEGVREDGTWRGVQGPRAVPW